VTSELPIACSLSATDLTARLNQMAELGRAALVDVRHQDRRAELRFADDAGVRDRVDGIVAAESQCCAFLELNVRDEPDTIALTIQAPHGAELVLQELVDAFRGRPHARNRGGC
jgi:hypothetical protein